MTKKRLILLILIIVAVWYFWGRDKVANGPAPEAQEEVAEESTSPQPSPNIGEGEDGGEPVAEGQARVHYFTKEALASCSVETVAVEQAVDSKYGHRAAGALVAMTLSMPADLAERYESALPQGTRLLTMQIDKEGVATADYNDALDAAGAPCVKAERRAQIENTLKEFSEIKNVVITVAGKVWE